MTQPEQPLTWREAKFYFLDQIRMLQLVTKASEEENFFGAMKQRMQRLNETLVKIEDKIKEYDQ